MKRMFEKMMAFVMTIRLTIRLCFRKDYRNALYELMTYFAIATLHCYRKEIVLSPVAGEKCEEFAERNKDIVQRVRDEAWSLYSYKLSSGQILKAIRVYTAPSLSARNTPVATRRIKR